MVGLPAFRPQVAPQCPREWLAALADAPPFCTRRGPWTIGIHLMEEDHECPRSILNTRTWSGIKWIAWTPRKLLGRCVRLLLTRREVNEVPRTLMLL